MMSFNDYKAKYGQRDTYICTRTRLASFLRRNGVKPFEVRMDAKNTARDVFEYHVDDNFMSLLYRYFELGER